MRHFFWPLYHQDHVEAIFEPSDLHFPNAYTHHLWESSGKKYLDEMTVDKIKNGKSLFSRINERFIMKKQEKIDILKKTIKVKSHIHVALEILNCQIGIEIGVRKGGNSKQLLNNTNFSKGKFYALDCWREVKDRPTFNDANYQQTELDKQYTSVVDMFKDRDYVEVVRDFLCRRI